MQGAVKNQSHGGGGGGGAGGSGPNSQKKSQNYSGFIKTVKTIAREGLLPCVVFCFSKVQTEDIPR
jgi:superfamily II RNA helicase